PEWSHQPRNRVSQSRFPNGVWEPGMKTTSITGALLLFLALEDDQEMAVAFLAGQRLRTLRAARLAQRQLQLVSLQGIDAQSGSRLLRAFRDGELELLGRLVRIKLECTLHLAILHLD